ncbi:hypothetical protein TcCL_ESM09255, partial [Trypanosoma cruzi]
MVPSGSSVELLGLRPQSRANSSPLSTQVVRQHVASNRSGFGYIDPPFLYQVARLLRLLSRRNFCSPRIAMPSGVRSICNMDRSILACCRRVDGATQTIAAKKAAQLSALIGCLCVQQKAVNCPLWTFSAATLTA